jgi:hypothetical protein
LSVRLPGAFIEAAGARMRRLCPTRQYRVTAGTPKNGDEGCGFVRA